MYWWSVYEPFSVISQFRFQSHHGPIRSVFHRFGIIGARCPPAMATGDNSWHVGGEREKTPGKLRFCSLVLDGSSRLPTHCISHILCDERHAIWSSRALLPPRSSFYLQRLGHFLSSQNVELSGRDRHPFGLRKQTLSGSMSMRWSLLQLQMPLVSLHPIWKWRNSEVRQWPKPVSICLLIHTGHVGHVFL